MASDAKRRPQSASAARRPQLSDVPSLDQFSDVHSPAAVRARQALRNDRLVKNSLDGWWATAQNSLRSSGRADLGCVEKADYIHIWIKIHRAMIEDWDEDEARESAEQEWDEDTRGEPALSEARFKDAIYECAPASTTPGPATPSL
jgi:hypothetical protein